MVKGACMLQIAGRDRRGRQAYRMREEACRLVAQGHSFHLITMDETLSAGYCKSVKETQATARREAETHTVVRVKFQEHASLEDSKKRDDLGPQKGGLRSLYPDVPS